VRIVVFGPEGRVGAWVGDQVIDLNKADSALPGALRPFIEGGSAVLDRAQRAIDRLDHAPADAVHELRSTKLQAPWPGLRIAAMGGNYARHMAGRTWERPGVLEETTAKIREAGPWGFFKVALPVGGPDDDVPYPRRTQYLDYEGEVAIVLGRKVKDFKGERIDDLVFGITLLNDWSIRDDQNPQRLYNFNLPKNFDGSTTLGPCIAVGEVRYDDVQVVTRVNGSVRQDYNSHEMVISFAECLEHLSRDLTLYPGDIISGGTSVGTATDQTPRPPEVDRRPTDLFLKPGDVVDVSSPAVGTLRNRVV
jgi:2-keto-4-pentenoate hydratase/2-oxohepta-3-ene-1,7-dioic acid hydratase in catechol pathway